MSHLEESILLQDMLTEQKKQSEAAAALQSPTQPGSSANAKPVQATDNPGSASEPAMTRPGLGNTSEPIQPLTQSSRPPEAGGRLAASDAEPLDADAGTTPASQDVDFIQSRQNKGSKQRWPGVVSEKVVGTGENSVVDRFGSADGKPSRDLKMDPVLQLAKWRESIFGSRDSITESRDSVSESLDNDDE